MSDVFNDGDMALCVDNTGATKELTVGKHYPIDHTTHDGLYTTPDNSVAMIKGFFKWRFKPIPKKKDIDYMQIAKDVAGHV